MRWNELYEKNKYRKYNEIEQVVNNIVLKARVKNFVEKYKKFLIISMCIIAILLVITFFSLPKTLMLILLIILIMIFSSIYFNTFTITCKNNKMLIKMDMQEIEIGYNNLKNVYIENNKTRLFFKKRDNFSLVILYKAPNGNISNIHLPIMFLNINDTYKFLKNFEVKKQKSDNIVKAQKYQLKRQLIKIALFVLIWIIIILTIIINNWLKKRASTFF